MWLNRSKEKEGIKFRKEQREGLRYREFQINTAESSQTSEVKPTGRLLKKNSEEDRGAAEANSSLLASHNRNLSVMTTN